MSKSVYHNAVDITELLEHDRMIVRAVALKLVSGEEPTAEEWVNFIQKSEYAVKIPMHEKSYAEPYYAWADGDEIVLTRGHTTPTRHDSDDAYLTSILEYYNPIPVSTDASSVIDG